MSPPARTPGSCQRIRPLVISGLIGGAKNYT